MNKTDSIARIILGWSLNRWDRWYDYETGTFIPAQDFQPEQNLDHAMLIVKKLEEYGFTYKQKSDCEVFFDDVCGRGQTLPEAITNAAYTIVERNAVIDSSRIWATLC